VRELQNPWIDRILNYGIKEEEMIKRIVRIKVIGSGDAFLWFKKNRIWLI